MESKVLTKFPAEDLRESRRLITSHNKEGKGVFVVDDVGEHHRLLYKGKAVGNIIYSTSEHPADMNDDKDMVFARDNEPPVHVTNGSVVRLIDFAPGMESPIHRAMSLDYGVVIEESFGTRWIAARARLCCPVI
ncbi:hypothetical protein G7Y89_g11899 [Cudoniella acicularis]|uniref:Uncharacterized protein n=1 Tax=Cudoniella acicularis TaxID=354080 RepID=A0A8H4W071_9HELO|nr:hypothetical protein G7Y89_g11899 [Cudoniella acicularis]